jgi:hypothetical protein
MTEEPDLDSRREALVLFHQALGSLSANQRDLILIMRSCAHACTLLGWSSQSNWFHQELQGYPEDSSLPWYRTGYRGIESWHTDNLGAAVASAVVEAHQSKLTIPADREFTFSVSQGLALVSSWSSTGYMERSGRTGKRRTFDGVVSEHPYIGQSGAGRCRPLRSRPM